MARANVFIGCMLLAVVAMVGASSVAAEERPHVPGVDWERMVIRATGSGAPDLNAPNIAVARLGAERAARMDAMRNILETLQGVQVTSGSTAGGVMASDSAVKARVEGVIRRFEVVDTRYFADGGVEVDVEMSILGEVAASLMPPERTGIQAAEGSPEISGLIVDASGLDLSPALAPRIVDEAGNQVYGAAVVDPEAVSNRGVVAYRRS
ncbi:MAG: LPP20 family lipoprotein, partial [Myxococcota bacterium]